MSGDTVIEGEPAHAADQPRGWWDNPVVIAAVILLCAVPLIYPKIPPLVDLFGHMGRYRVELDIGHSPWLRDYYGFHWAAIGNLGVDLLVIPMNAIFGLESGVKLIVLAIPPLTAAGLLWVAHEVHGRIPPTAFFALPFIYGHPFLFGFVNFGLSMALAFLAFAWWLRLGRVGKTKLRAWLFVPISVIVFFCHTYGWGVLGLLCFSAEAVRQHDRGVGWLRAGFYAALHASVMALPILITLVWRSEAHGGLTGDWFNWKLKLEWLYTALRDRWRLFDFGSLIFVGLIFLFAVVSAVIRWQLTFSRNLFFSALVLVAGFIIIPRIVFGSAYADMRLAPYMIAVAVLAIRFRGAPKHWLAQGLAIFAIAFVVLRMAGTTASMAIAADDQQEQLAALDHIPMGARVVTLVGDACGFHWPLPRNSHLGAMVTVRREGFSNDQWVLEGMNLLDLHYAAADGFAADPSQRARPNGCQVGLLRSIDEALRGIPRHAFDFVWLVEVPPFDPALTKGLQPVWRTPGSILYRIPK
jgi:hypothetical protein